MMSCRDLGLRVLNTHKTIGDFKTDYKEMCKQLTEHLKDDFESRIQMVEWELDDIVEDIFKDEQEEKIDDVPEETGASEPVDDVDDPVNHGGASEPVDDPVNHGGLCGNCENRFTSPIIYKCSRQHKVCYPCRNLVKGCYCPICQKLFRERKKLGNDLAASMMFRLANASNFEKTKKVHLEKRTSVDDAGMSPMIMNVWSVSDQDNSLVMDADVAVKTEPGDDDMSTNQSQGFSHVSTNQSSEFSSSSIIPEHDLGSKMLTLIDPNVVASGEGLMPSSPDQQPINYNDDDQSEHTDQSTSSLTIRRLSSQSGSSIGSVSQSDASSGGPIKVRRVSGEDWMQSLQAGNRTLPTGNSSSRAVWERYKNIAKLSGSITTSSNVSISRVKTVKPAPSIKTSSHMSLNITPVPDDNYQPSDTDRYQTASVPSYDDQSQLSFQTTDQSQGRTHHTSSSITAQPGSSVMTSAQFFTSWEQATDPLQIRTIRVKNPRKIVAKPTHSLTNFYTEQPIGSDINQSESRDARLGSTEEDQFITPDSIEDSFNEIEKYLEATDNDNIFEKNLDNVSQPTSRPPEMFSYSSSSSLPPPPRLTPAPHIGSSTIVAKTEENL